MNNDPHRSTQHLQTGSPGQVLIRVRRAQPGNPTINTSRKVDGAAASAYRDHCVHSARPAIEMMDVVLGTYPPIHYAGWLGLRRVF